jgi:hypothetical protein
VAAVVKTLGASQATGTITGAAKTVAAVVKTLGASQATGTITGAAKTVAAAASDALDALAAALVRHAELGRRRYTITVDDHLVAIVVTGRGHHGSDLSSLEELVAEIRQTCR